jgi:F-box protein 9
MQQISHLITYHRLLRFFPDGTVVCLLTNEEKPLAEMVHLLKPSIRVKGSSVGKWVLEDTKRRLRIRHLKPPDPGNRSFAKYEFAMDLTLSSARNMR